MVGWHTPTLVASSQASHWPSQARSQQTPSTQNPLEHWFEPAHGAPVGSPATHTPAAQYSAAAQSESTVQLPAHWVAPHEYGVQTCDWSGPQEPPELHVCASVATPFVQLAGVHTTDTPG